MKYECGKIFKRGEAEKLKAESEMANSDIWPIWRFIFYNKYIDYLRDGSQKVRGISF